MTNPQRPDWAPESEKGFHDPILGWIVGYDTPEEFYAAVTDWNLAHGLDADGNPLPETD